MPKVHPIDHPPCHSDAPPGRSRTSAIVRAYAERVLGPCTLLTDAARSSSHVIAVLDSQRRCWFVKHVLHPRKWRAEIRAFEEWVPAIRSRAPQLHHADHDMRMMTLTEVSGQTPRKFGPLVHHQAGDLLRRLHDSAPPASPSKTPRWRRNPSRQRVAALLRSGDPTLLSATEAAFVSAEITRQTRQTRQTDLLAQPLVPCHGDYRPANWIEDVKGRLHVIDFGQACLEPRAFDLTRLALGPWWGRPGLATAFMEGYGRDLSDGDRSLITTQAVVHTVTILTRARQNSDEWLEERARHRLHALLEGHPAVEA